MFASANTETMNAGWFLRNAVTRLFDHETRQAEHPMIAFYCGSCHRSWERGEEETAGEIKNRRDDKRGGRSFAALLAFTAPLLRLYIERFFRRFSS